MKLAAYSVGDWNYVGIVDSGAQTIEPLDVSSADAAGGVLCLIERAGDARVGRRAGSRSRCRRSSSERPFPCLTATSSASARTITSTRTNLQNRASIRVPPRGRCPIIRSSFQNFPNGDCSGRDHPHRPHGVGELDYEAELAVIIGKGGRNIRQDRRDGACVGLYHRQ